ncbi:glycosyltransferase family 4 protein [Bradyrhizobium sp. SSUT18]|uniref:glycosyltransferase family 4 protein n=1 Tax=Bradyrhizobium sp. SSUT18 TaxID=3040602 RepID=UPI002447D6A9|nr:glycosyltransferase family 4 protein [Bradyrhizobium sp. SSUT18]MDH2403170.1 glycosyltransferase family 4 protein [Bradyrhizobium sp. SSUT18]
MRILHFTERLGPGGKERQIVELLRGLSADRDIKSFVAVTDEEKVRYEVDPEHAEIIQLVRKRRRDLRLFKSLHELVSNLRIDIVHSWSPMCSVYAAPIAKLCGSAFVNGFVRDAPPHLSRWDKDYLMGKLTVPFSDIVVANSRAGLAAYQIPQRKGFCIYNGFDPERISKLTDEAELRSILGISTPHVVGMVAHFTPRKDYPTFVEMACRICQLREDVTFVTVGTGQMLSQVRDSVPPEYSSRIKFLGLRKDVESIANLFTVGVLVSHSGEGFSNAITECMALGKPVVATRDGGNPELILEGQTGFLVPRHDAVVLTDRVLKLLDNRGLASEFGMEGRRRIETSFSLDTMTNAYLGLYRRVADRRARAT